MKRGPQPGRHPLVQNLADQAVPEPKPPAGLSDHPGGERRLDHTHQVPRRPPRHHLKVGDGELSAKHRRPPQRGDHMSASPSSRSPITAVSEIGTCQFGG